MTKVVKNTFWLACSVVVASIIFLSGIVYAAGALSREPQFNKERIFEMKLNSKVENTAIHTRLDNIENKVDWIIRKLK